MYNSTANSTDSTINSTSSLITALLGTTTTTTTTNNKVCPEQTVRFVYGCLFLPSLIILCLVGSCKFRAINTIATYLASFCDKDLGCMGDFLRGYNIRNILLYALVLPIFVVPTVYGIRGWILCQHKLKASQGGGE